MIQLAYLSSTRSLLNVYEIAEILIKSRENNEKRGITGMLLYKDGNVLQILEGEEDPVRALFEKISNDPRHSGVLRLYEKSVEVRDFSEWTMGFHDLEAEGARYLEGFSEFLDPLFDISQLKPSTAARLLSLFKQGVR